MIALVLLVSCLQPVRTETECGSCHGSADSWAPPEALGGFTDTTYIGVGAHQPHREAAVACDQCHVVPASVGDEGHLGPWPAEVAWGEVATTGGATTPWDRDAGTCTVYCHGTTLAGGTLTAPSWTVVDGTQAACGTCHGLPPPLPHVADTACDGCHLPTAGPGQTIADATTHADGVVQQGGTAGCAGCHGDDDSLAPPPDSTGETDPTERSVGAHRAHVFPSDAAEVACDECHVVPATVDDEDHIDTAPAEVTFGSLASFAAADPVWSTTTFTCSGAYCHGATLGGGDLTTPTWTATDGAAAACGACHGMPPPSPHPSSTGCSGCHPPAGPGQTIDQPARHIDGSLDL